MDLPAAFDLELPHFDLDEALDFLNRAAQQSDDNDDGLRYLFEEAESELAIPRGECSVHDSATLQADSIDEDLEDCNDYNQSTTPQASLGPAEAAMNGAPLGSEGTSAPGEAHLEMTASALTASLTQDALYHTEIALRLLSKFFPFRTRWSASGTFFRSLHSSTVAIIWLQQHSRHYKHLCIHVIRLIFSISTITSLHTSFRAASVHLNMCQVNLLHRISKKMQQMS